MYTWGKYWQTSQSTVRDRRNAYKRDPQLELAVLKQGYEWVKNGEKIKFQDWVIKNLFGWNRKELIDSVIQECVQEALEMNSEPAK